MESVHMLSLHQIIKKALQECWDLTVRSLVSMKGNEAYMQAFTDKGTMFVKTHRVDQGERRKNIVQGLRVQMGLRELGFLTSEIFQMVDGALDVERGGYGITVERWIEQVDCRIGLSDWERLGELAGQLHALHIPDELADCLSRFEPRRTFNQVQRQIELCKSKVPVELRERLDSFCGQAEQLSNFDSLPHSLIHTDLTWDNVVKDKGGNLVLLDFEGAGIGPSIMELAEVTTKLCDGPSGSGPLRLPDAQAFYKGYCSHRCLTAEEVQRLPEAHFYHQYYYLADSLSRGDFDFIRRMDARLTRWENDVFGSVNRWLQDAF